MDATHLGRNPTGRAVQAEVLRDVASTRTIGISAGPEATAMEVMLLLDLTTAARGSPPLVLITDNGGAYRCTRPSASRPRIVNGSSTCVATSLARRWRQSA